MKDCKTPLYLTGGTALSRFYFHHRYSEDLDFFVNNEKEFSSFVTILFESIEKKQTVLNYTIDISNIKRFDNFTQIFLVRNDSDHTTLKIDIINDIAEHNGGFLNRKYGRIDSWENILSNKISALYRLEAKDVIDIWIIAKNRLFQWKNVMSQAKRKDAGIDPTEISEILQTFPIALSEKIKWSIPYSADELLLDIHSISKDILLGHENSLCENKK